MNLGKTMTISEGVTKAFQNYDNFKGRASRTEYLSFAFFCNFVLLVASMTLFHSFIPLAIVATTISIPSFAIAVRRLHDVGRSGLWLLVLIWPLTTAIMMIVTHLKGDQMAVFWSILCLIGVLASYLPARWLNSPGNAGDNIYGPDPFEEDMRSQSPDGLASTI